GSLVQSQPRPPPPDPFSENSSRDIGRDSCPQPMAAWRSRHLPDRNSRSVSMTEHRIPTQDGGDFAAYVALPQTTPAPAIILLQEVYGVNRFMQKIADFWALEGFIAICPDLYWRIAPGIVLDPETEGHRDRALETRKQMEID